MTCLPRHSCIAPGLVLLVSLLPTPALGRPRSADEDTSRLSQTVAAQQRRLDAQQQELEAQRRQVEELRALVLQQGRALDALHATHPAAPDGMAGREPAGPAPSAVAEPLARAPSALAMPAAPSAVPASSAAAAQVSAASPTSEVSPKQAVEQETPSASGFELGAVRLRPGGYFAVTGIYRSTNSGGSVGTNFATTPFEDRVQGNVSEARLSAQSTRLSLRADGPRGGHVPRMAGYLEMDFAGSTPGTVAVTSSGVGVRLRHVFGDVTINDTFSLGIGQAFSLMTPPQGHLSIWPSDYALSQAVDTNYVAGLVWARLPQVRVTWRPSRRLSWAVSVENPEQQVGSGRVTWPACCGDDLRAQYNTGSEELKVPNLVPDVATRVAFNAGTGFHADVGGVLRVFRHTLSPYDGDDRRVGGGVSANLGIRAGRATKVLLQGSWGSGMGRYIGGLVPDAVVRADGTISPVSSASWVAGVEHVASRRVSLSGYFSGVYADENVALDADGTLIGFGYPGAPDSHNRVIQEATGIVIWQVVQTADRGSVQWNAQTSWLSRSPWSRGDGPASADAFLFLTQIRYNLP